MLLMYKCIECHVRCVRTFLHLSVRRLIRVSVTRVLFVCEYVCASVFTFNNPNTLLFASAQGGTNKTLCSWQYPRLALLSKLGNRAAYSFVSLINPPSLL